MFVTLADVVDSISDLNLAKKGEGKIQLWTLLMEVLSYSSADIGQFLQHLSRMSSYAVA